MNWLYLLWGGPVFLVVGMIADMATGNKFSWKVRIIWIGVGVSLLISGIIYGITA